MKACVCVFWGTKAIWCSLGRIEWQTQPSHSADRMGLNKKQIVAILYQLCNGLSRKCNWFEYEHAVFLKDCNLNQQGLIAEHLIGSSYNSQKANEIFQNLFSCNTRSINELVSGAILHKRQLVQLMIDGYIHYCVYTAKLTLASQRLLNSSAQLLNIRDPEYQKIRIISIGELKLPLWHFVVAHN